MPTLKHLLEELQKISVDPDEVHIPGQLYDDLVGDAEDITAESQKISEGEDNLNEIKTAGAVYPPIVIDRVQYTITLLKKYVSAIDNAQSKGDTQLLTTTIEECKQVLEITTTILAAWLKQIEEESSQAE
jgi:hypothetical protein